jgi:hypothetical protein
MAQRMTPEYGDSVVYRTKLAGRQEVKGIVVRGPYADADLDGMLVVAVYSTTTHAVSILPVGKATVEARPQDAATADRVVEIMRQDYERELRKYGAWARHFETTPALAQHLFAENPWAAVQEWVAAA